MTKKQQSYIGEKVTDDKSVDPPSIPDDSFPAPTATIGDPVPGAPVAGPSVGIGYTDNPTPAELAIAFPGVEHPTAARLYYNPDGTVVRPDQQVAPEDLGPEGMPPVTQADAPFSTGDIPADWNRHPTQVEVDYLNAKYPVDGYVPPPPDVTGTFTSFTQSNPTVVYADLEDTDALGVGFLVTLMALSGTPEGIAAIDGINATVLSVTPVTLDIDLSGVDTTGLVADYVWEAP